MATRQEAEKRLFDEQREDMIKEMKKMVACLQEAKARVAYYELEIEKYEIDCENFINGETDV